MSKLFSVLAAFLSFVSLVLVAVSIATNYWVKLSPDTQPQSPLNPLANDTFSDPTLLVQYNLDYFGLWVGCHREVVSHCSALSAASLPVRLALAFKMLTDCVVHCVCARPLTRYHAPT